MNQPVSKLHQRSCNGNILFLVDSLLIIGRSAVGVEKQQGSPKHDFGANVGYLTELYELYLKNPSDVSSEMQEFFGREPSGFSPNGLNAPVSGHQDDGTIQKVIKLVNSIRDKGHLLVQLDPLGRKSIRSADLTFSAFGLSEKNVQAVPVSAITWDRNLIGVSKTAFEYIEQLRRMYSGSVAYEFSHLRSDDERDWLYEVVEAGTYKSGGDVTAGRTLLQRLLQVEGFEHYLHRQFPGQKWFSLEGNDVLIPFLDSIVHNSVQSAISQLVIGMAHRGRLNVLAHILGKPYNVILTEFEGGKTGLPKEESAYGWMRDVKYHLGASREYIDDQGKSLIIELLPNASHLELVNPVASGATKALQDNNETDTRDAAIGVLIHGDAGFAGEGIVAETLNMAKLSGYSTGGSIHIILNNQIGFTTDPQDTFGTCYASDLARGFDLPVIHVNADDLESCLSVAALAFAYRQKFGKDVVVDLVGYRRYGHNEGDEPSFTQPSMYNLISNHATIATQLSQKLAKAGEITSKDIEGMIKNIADQLEEARMNPQDDSNPQSRMPSKQPLAERERLSHSPDFDSLMLYDQALHKSPENFEVHAKLKRQFAKRAQVLEKGVNIDWAHAEALALASILDAGISVRLTGQDSERGTFSHRHSVLHDVTNDGNYTPLQNIVDPQKATFSVLNSPLSEEAALGFEYGYSVYTSDTLVLWEAQFGDFINNAQAVVDELVVSAQAKWGQRSGLVLLLPHGYEGMGPNHSSAYLERFLQLASFDNIQVINCTTSAQYFYMLRRHALSLGQDPKPLIVLTPKSLLRHPQASSQVADFIEGSFQEVIDDPHFSKNKIQVRKLVLCSGKVYIDLITSSHYAEATDIAIIRVEQLYPFPENQLQSVLSSYKNISQIAWLQEEPQNRGAWNFIEPRLKGILKSERLIYIGRQDFPSQAEGSSSLHKTEQDRIIKTALSKIGKKIKS